MPITSLLAAAMLSAAVLDVAAAPMQEFEPVSVPMQVIQVAPHSYYVLGQAGMVSSANEGFNANAGFVVTSDGVVVFDALGTPALGRRFADFIAKTTKQPVRRVIVSHYHADHFYGLQAFKKPGVDVWAHQLVRAPRRVVWNATITMVGRSRGRWACGQGAKRLVHMSTGRY